MHGRNAFLNSAPIRARPLISAVIVNYQELSLSDSELHSAFVTLFAKAPACEGFPSPEPNLGLRFLLAFRPNPSYKTCPSCLPCFLISLEILGRPAKTASVINLCYRFVMALFMGCSVDP